MAYHSFMDEMANSMSVAKYCIKDWREPNIVGKPENSES